MNLLKKKIFSSLMVWNVLLGSLYSQPLLEPCLHFTKSISELSLYGVNHPLKAIDKHALVRLSISQLHREAFDSVFSNSRFLRHNLPEDPIGYFLAANAYQTIMRDYRVRCFEEEFDSLINVAIQKAKKRLQVQPNAENYFVLGVVSGYQCVYLFRQRKWLKAIGAARKSKKALKTAIELKPDFVDPLFGLALHEYAQSKIFNVGIGLFRHKRKTAIAKLWKVRQENQILSVNATYTLQLIYFEGGHFEDALKLNDQLYACFPKNLVCLYNRALLLENVARFSEAITIWEKLIQYIKAFSYPSNSYLIEAHYHLAKIYHKLRDIPKCRDQLKIAQGYLTQYQAEKELDGPYISFKDIRKAIKKSMKKWKLSE